LVARSRNRWCHAYGFTLLELLVVLVIAGMLVALVPPLISGAVPAMQAKAAARELAVALRDARFVAISRNTLVDVRFDFETGSYRVADAPAQTLPVGVGIAMAGNGEYSGGGRASPADYTLRFYADGSSNGLLARVGPAHHGFIVSVDWLMGRVALTEAPAGVQ
jgi:general secretion pathway protein H